MKPITLCAALMVAGVLGGLAGPDRIAAPPAGAHAADASARQATTASDSDDRPVVAGRRNRPRQAAWPMFLLLSAGLAMVTVALVIWIVHWGRSLKSRSGPAGQPGASRGPDPWVLAGQRLRPDKPSDEPSDEQSDKPPDEPAEPS